MTDTLADLSGRPIHDPLTFPGRERIGGPLPESVTGFVGREREVQQAISLLDRPDVRLVTLTGPGGVGKSRLALAVAHRVRERFPDGCGFVDLTLAPTPERVLPTIALALGMREAAHRPIADQLVDFLRDRRVLLVLDNFEAVIDAAPAVAQILASCTYLHAIVTSREPLRISAEWVLVVPPLSVPDSDSSLDECLESNAVQLFLDRARQVRADFAPGEEETRAIGGIVRRVDGLPLAIELAAARVGQMPVSMLLHRLHHRLPLLTDGMRDAPERQRTMRGAIIWSYDLLPGDEQRLFRNLSVFSGGCDWEAAGVVALNGAVNQNEVMDVMARLVSKSLLQQSEDEAGILRFTMLDTVREFALEQLAAHNEEQELRERHAAYFRDLAEQADPAIWGKPEHTWWLDRLQVELPNLRSALGWLEHERREADFIRIAGAMGGVWVYRSHRIEGRHWLRRAVDMDGSTVPLAHSTAIVKLSMIEWGFNGPDAVDLARRGLAIRQAHGDRWSTCRAMLNLGAALKCRGDNSAAASMLADAAILAEQNGDLVGLASCRIWQGFLRQERQDLAHARELMEEAVALYTQAKFGLGVAETLLELGKLDAEGKDWKRAAERYAESLQLWSLLRNEDGLIDAFVATAELAAEHDMPAETARLMGTAAAIRDRLGYVEPPETSERARAWEAEARSALGNAAFDAAWRTGRDMPSGAHEVANSVLSAIVKRASEGQEAKAQGGLFTKREHDVLRLLVEGQSDREIAQSLGVGYRTVTSHVRSILAKLNVNTRTAAATQAVRRGLA